MSIHTIIITGGAGYIGSVTAALLAKQGFHCIIIDIRITPGLKNLLVYFPHIRFFQADFSNTKLLDYIFKKYTPKAIIHCAASIESGLSITKPAEFYNNNVSKTVVLLDLMRKHSVLTIVFSSSSAVYGTVQAHPLQSLCEDHPIHPLSPYGKTKYIVEQILHDYTNAYNLKALALRYFNAAGGWPEYRLGEYHDPETHIIPLLLKSAEQNSPFTIFGTDYPTQDGTCVRDYIHVKDIAYAHLHALTYLEKLQGKNFLTLNIGSGIGFSVQEIIATISRLTAKSVKITYGQRRSGDPAYLQANISQAQKLLSWRPEYSSLEEIISSAYQLYTLNFF